MTLDRRDYPNMTDYLSHLYGCSVYTRAGMAHPVAVFQPSAGQTRDIDSLLDPTPPTNEPRDFAFYDYSYLRDLQNSKPDLYNGAAFTMKEIRQRPLRLRGSIGRYYDMLATCAALERELRATPAEGWTRAPFRAALHRALPPSEALRRGTGRSAAIGIGTLTVCNVGGTYQAILARRSQATAFDSGMYHVLPAMMFQPTTPDFADRREWSLKHQILRETLEELFGLPETRAPARWDYFYNEPALGYLLALMAAGEARLLATGLILNLLTLRPEVASLLLIHDPAWHLRVTDPYGDMPLSTADETESGSLVFAPIESDAAFLSQFPPDLRLRMPAQATATMWLGIDLARREIAARDIAARGGLR